MSLTRPPLPAPAKHWPSSSGQCRTWTGSRSITGSNLTCPSPELNPVESVWSHLKRSLANLVKRDITQLTALVKTRLRRMQ